MGTTIGAAIDYLVGIFENGLTSPVVVPALTTIDPDAVVGDVFPDEAGNVLIVVGRANDQADSEIAATAQYQVLGAQRISEAYRLPVHIVVTGEGPAYKSVRDQALALFDGVTKLVWADPTLGGILQNGRVGVVSEFVLTQPDAPTGEQFASGSGVSASVSLAVEIQNSYIP